MPDELRERIARILASATRLEKREAAQEASISIFGDFVFVSGDVHISHTSEQNQASHDGGLDLPGK